MTDAATLVMHAVTCPLCDCDESVASVRTPDWTGFVPGEFQLVCCRNCRHVYLNPAPVDASLAACYPEDYGPHQRPLAAAAVPSAPCRTTAESNLPSVEEARPWYLSPIVRALPGLRAYFHWATDTKSVWIPRGDGNGKQALELGCSSGWFLAQLRDRGWTPVGVDLVSAPLERAREAGFEVHHGTLESVSFDDGRFHAVFAWMVLEHVPRPRETLSQIARVLKPGGWFALSVPNRACWEPVVFGRHWRGYDLPRHLQHFTARRLENLLRDAGFDVIEVMHQPSSLYWTSSFGSWLRRAVPQWSLGERLMTDYESHPPLAFSLCLGPLARLNAALRQSGRITIVTRRR